MDFNTVSIMGRLTADPKVFESDGKMRVQFSLANNKNKNEVNYVECIMFQKPAELFIVLDLKKGDQLIVNGSLSISTYDTKDNIKQKSVSIIVSGFNIVQRKKVVKKQAVMA